MPWFKVPMHVSYLLYLDQFSRPLAMTYWRMALTLCRLSGVAPSLLLHPLDFLGRDDDRDLDFFPAMRSTSARKVELVGKVIDEMAKHYQIVPMREHANTIMRLNPEVQPYSEGVASHSPGLLAERATLGQEMETTKYPEGVSSSA
jgi:hypothetical protein